ncbi:MAG: hypothetical protein ACK4YF_04115 [Exilispira sp.]
MKKRKFLLTLMIFTLLIVNQVIFIQISAQDPKTLFIEYIKKQQAVLPKNFSCIISSSIFTEFLSQLPSDAFSKQLKDINIILSVENGKPSINIDGINQQYNDFALSYFNIYLELLSFVFISEEELNRQFENFTITENKNTFILLDNSELISYKFTFLNYLLSSISFFQENIKKMDINIQYFTYKNYQLVKSINIINFDEKGNIKENILITFSKYKL